MFTFHAYENPKAVGYAGWIDDGSGSWVLFIPLGGGKPFFCERG